jgi:hypothetical protein
MHKIRAFQLMLVLLTTMPSLAMAQPQSGEVSQQGSRATEQGIPAGISDSGPPPSSIFQSHGPKHILQGGVLEQQQLPEQTNLQSSAQNTPLMGGADQQNLFPNLAPPMNASVGQQQFNGRANGQQLNGNANGQQFNLGASAVNRLGQPLQGSGQNEISALGLDWQMRTGRVNAVDPASDLYGVVGPGDRILALDGNNPFLAWQTGQNFGNIGTICVVTYMHDGMVNTVRCRRQAVSNFQPKNQKLLNWGALRNH